VKRWEADFIKAEIYNELAEMLNALEWSSDFVLSDFANVLWRKGSQLREQATEAKEADGSRICPHDPI